MLQVIIGLVFVMLLFSLLASTVLEFIAGFLSLRGKRLVSAIQSMVGGNFSQAFIHHPYFQQLAIGSSERARVNKTEEVLPSYINAGTFSSIFIDLLEVDTPDQLQIRIDQLEEGPLKKLILFLYRQAGGDILAFKLKIENWFNEVMDRASGTYKRSSQRWLFCIGLTLAVIFNADAIMIYHNLSMSATLREMVNEAAGSYVNNNPAPAAPNLTSPNMEVAQEQIGKLINENIASLESPLGLGWTNINQQDMNLMWWLYRVIGWLTTALSISLGATFWFDILKKLINIRASGPAPTPAPLTTTTVTQTTPAPSQTVMNSGGVLTAPPADSMFERSAKPQSRGVQKPPKPKDAKS